MHVIESLRRVDRFFGKAGLTIGNFDGFHRGHREIVDRLVRESKKRGCYSALITFRQHPMKVLGMDEPTALTVPSEKIRMFKKAGVDLLLFVDFTPGLGHMEPAPFLSLMEEILNPRFFCLGRGFRFGRENAGDIYFLQANADRTGFDLITVDEVLYGGIPVSSTRIRKCIADGDLESAERMLGRAYGFFFAIGKNGLKAVPLYQNPALPGKGVYRGELTDLSTGNRGGGGIRIENGEAWIEDGRVLPDRAYRFGFSG